jgi:hypothetical protein
MPNILTGGTSSAMAHAVSYRHLTVEVLVRSRVSPCGICGGQSGTGTGFSPEYFGFPMSVSFHRCSSTWKYGKLIIFITGLHNKPLGCGASVACAAGPFKEKVGHKEGNIDQCLSFIEWKVACKKRKVLSLWSQEEECRVRRYQVSCPFLSCLSFILGNGPEASKTC